MHIHPEIRNVLAHQKQRDLVAAAERSRSLSLTRRRDPVVSRYAGHEITMRPAAAADARALTRLAILDHSKPLAAEVLLAEVEGELWAACSLADGRTIADPFRPTRATRALLALRREQLAAANQLDPVGERRTLRWLRQLRLGT